MLPLTSIDYICFGVSWVDCLVKFELLAERQTKHLLKMIQTDNAKEFIHMWKWLEPFGTVHYLSCPHTHQQMGKVERRHQHIANMTLAIMKHARVLQIFWNYGSVMCAAYDYNRILTSLLSGKFSMEHYSKWLWNTTNSGSLVVRHTLVREPIGTTSWMISPQHTSSSTIR